MTADLPGGLPAYVERGGECVYSPPGVALGVRMYAFILRGDSDALQLMFDRYLNTPSSGAVQYSPAGEFFVLNFTTLRHVGALIAPDLDRGYFTESEMAIWTLGYDSVSDTYATFVPYMVVDQGAAMAMGREVYGFPKQLGDVHMPTTEAKLDFGLDVMGVAEWGPGEPFTKQRLIEITHTPPADPPAPPGGAEHRDFGSQLQLVLAMANLASQDPGLGTRGGKRRNDNGPDMLDALELLTGRTLPMVFLKQVRDGRMPLRACYQAVQRADFVVTDYRGADRLPGEFAIDIASLANEPIRYELGLPLDGPVHPVDAFVVDFDFQLTVAEEVWRSGVQHVTARRSR